MRSLLVPAGLLAALAFGACTSPAPTPVFAPAAAPAASSAAPSPSTVAASPTPSPTVAPVRYVFPVRGKTSYARTHHDYQASDVMAPCGATVVAVTDGVVLEVSRVDKWDSKTDRGADRGGLSVSFLGDDGVRYYGSHFSAIDPLIRAGERVQAGQVLGKVGRTGLAGACHLHFGISAVCARTGDWWIRRGVIWPWRYLDSWRKNGARSPVAEITAWQTRPGCTPTPPPGA